jgi:Fe-Mn family superoxide dismutase
MEIHHDKHHGTYVTKLNAALEKYPDLQKKSIQELLSKISAIPDDIRGPVRNNGGGHLNHTMFWQLMKPGGGGQPSGPLADAINSAFGIRTTRSWTWPISRESRSSAWTFGSTRIT